MVSAAKFRAAEQMISKERFCNSPQRTQERHKQDFDHRLCKDNE